jgi:CheY-like chemotaxis protein
MSTRNITAMVENEFQLRYELSAALERAQEASRAKSGFLFNISHDIRTPMNAILGFNEIAMKHVGDNEQAADALRKARYAGEHMLNLINDILDMSRIESGKVTLREEIISVKEHISRFEDMFRITMEKKQLSFRIIDETYTTHIYGDYLRITQIIANLLSNAAKFTPAGGEVVYQGTEFDPGEEGYTAFRISVRDTGIGISEEFKEKLFLPFEREKSATNSGVQGTGLGLAIVKQLVDLMGGTLVCNSTLGKGTEFILTFKARIAELASEEDESKAFDASMLKGKRILLVEDNELNREIAAEMLAELDIAVIEADDGAKAVDMLKSWSGDAPDAILMDIQMPIMDGYTATVAIRALESPLSTLPIIAMTANAFEEDKRKAIACGMNAHMGKPISMQGMTETLCSVLCAKTK